MRDWVGHIDREKVYLGRVFKRASKLLYSQNDLGREKERGRASKPTF